MNFKKAQQLTITQAVKLLGLTRADITEHTYIYLDEEFQLCAIDKPDRTADPIDEIFSLGYAMVYEDYAEVGLQEAATMNDVSVQAVRDALKAGKFPNARRNGEAPRGDWRIPMQDVIAWKPRRAIN